MVDKEMSEKEKKEYENGARCSNCTGNHHDCPEGVDYCGDYTGPFEIKLDY